MSGEISLSIGKLAIHGFTRAEARRVEDAFRAELIRLGPQLDNAASVKPRIMTELPPRASTTPERVGTHAARALVVGLKP